MEYIRLHFLPGEAHDEVAAVCGTGAAAPRGTSGPRLRQSSSVSLLSASRVSAGYYKLNSPVNTFWGPL